MGAREMTAPGAVRRVPILGRPAFPRGAISDLGMKVLPVVPCIGELPDPRGTLM
jgi:hypothetical protein